MRERTQLGLDFDSSPPTEESNARAEAAALEAARQLAREGYEVTVSTGAFEDGFRWRARLTPSTDELVAPRARLAQLAAELGGELVEYR